MAPVAAPDPACRRRAASSGRRRRPAHSRSAVAVPRRRGLSRHHRGERGGGAREADGLSFDLLILDVMMPGETGFELAKSIRQTSTVPILMLTARDDAESRITGLEIGADDYMAKPFEPRELSLRIANILKRTRRRRRRAPSRSGSGSSSSTSCAPNCARRRDDAPDRSRARNDPDAGEQPGRDRAAHGARGQWRTVNERAVDVQVNRLRRKIERDPTNPLIVQTVRGIGYRLVVSP